MKKKILLKKKGASKSLPRKIFYLFAILFALGATVSLAQERQTTTQFAQEVPSPVCLGSCPTPRPTRSAKLAPVASIMQSAMKTVSPSQQRAKAPKPAPKCTPAKKEKSTSKYKATYGSSAAKVKSQLVTIKFQGKKVKVHKKIQALFLKVNKEITALKTGYKFRLVGTYAWRQKKCPSGCSGLSLHSFGTTMDINWDTNPYTSAKKHDIPPSIVKVFKKNGFTWGGDWKPNHDWMHFQYNGICK